MLHGHAFLSAYICNPMCDDGVEVEAAARPVAQRRLLGMSGSRKAVIGN